MDGVDRPAALLLAVRPWSRTCEIMDTTEPIRLDRAAALEARRLRGVTVDEDVEINVPTDRVGSECRDDLPTDGIESRNP